MTILQAATAPQYCMLEGQFCRLEPLAPKHLEDLFNAIDGPQVDKRHQYLLETAPASVDELATWLEQADSNPDLMFFAVIDKSSGKCGGRQALMRIRHEHGSIEIGSILWGKGIARTRMATEALYLFAKHIFEDLGNRRFEWKCNNDNIPSKRAANRFGFTFEGVFRQDLILRNKNRDTAWFSMLDSEWPTLRAHYDTWLKPDNFDEKGIAKTSLTIPRV